MGNEHARNLCIVASGETYPHRHVLYQLGFMWIPNEKVWIWDYKGDLKHRDEMQRSLNKLRGVTVTEERRDKFFKPV